MKLERIVQPIAPRPLHTEVADRLRDLIVQGELAPGDRLNERMLTERFGISRTPLREAIKMLASEGLVQLLPNRGAVVTSITRANALDMFQVMGVLESLAGQLACERASDRDIAEIEALHEQMRLHHKRSELNEYFRLNQHIHQRIVDCAGNSELADIYRRLSVRLRRARYMANFSRERWDKAMEEHNQIFQALAERDSKRLKTLLGTHLENKFKVIEDWLETLEAESAGQLPAGA
jgi:DNA-binding GntR family transcriptional regulator